MTYDLLSVYPAKLVEYGLGVGYLILFIPFWRYVQGGRPAPAAVPALAGARAAVSLSDHAAEARRAAATGTGWFHVPEGVHLHPGHTWARLETDGLVTVGIDDFAQKLVGPAAVTLPAAGAHLAQGEPVVYLGDGAKSVALVAPVDGTVVSVNKAGAGTDAPYGAGWLFKVKAPRLAANLRQLLSGAAAQRLLEDASERLALRLSPELGAVLQDGGAPVSGIAQVLAGDDWDTLARSFFLT
jgi:glycine cleavage system H lipoate-binding protein